MNWIRGADARHIAMAASLAVAGLMLVGKLAAFFLTHSTAILADAAESTIHIVATGVAAYSLWFTAQPADPDHPYGHGKFAYFSAGFEGALILGTGLAIIDWGVLALFAGARPVHLGVGLGLLAALAVVNFALGRYLIRTGERTHSLVLVSNGQHVLTDMWTSIAVVTGVLLVWLTKLAWLDALVAILAGLNILRGAIQLLSQFFQGLMEKADPRETADLLVALQKSLDDGLVSSFHQLRHRRVNDQVWIDFHLLFPGGLSITEAHAQASEVEERLRALFPRDCVYITSHLEPDDDDHEATHPGGHPGFPDPFEPLV